MFQQLWISQQNYIHYLLTAACLVNCAGAISLSSWKPRTIISRYYTRMLVEGLGSEAKYSVYFTHPSPTLCLWASAYVMSPADLIKSFRSLGCHAQNSRDRQTDTHTHTYIVRHVESFVTYVGQAKTLKHKLCLILVTGGQVCTVCTMHAF